nr:GNAT family protein [Agrobacterium sp.]
MELNVYTWNAPAIRTYAKVGFVPEGVRRSSVQVGDERWDTAIMGMLRAEWGAL